MSDDRKAMYKVFIRGSAEAVWREISKTDELQKAFFNNWLEARAFAPGNKFRMLTPSRKYAGVVGEILEVDPPRRYVHTMRFTNFDDPAWKVIHEIRPASGGVEYQMTLEGLPVGTKSAKQAAQGMTMIANTLKAIVENGRPGLGMRLLFVLFGLLERTSPPSTRAENWPV